VQLVGAKARRNNVVLVDRDKADVFYTRVSGLEDFFVCIQQHAAFLVQRAQAVRVQIERACELVLACRPQAFAVGIMFRPSILIVLTHVLLVR